MRSSRSLAAAAVLALVAGCGADDVPPTADAGRPSATAEAPVAPPEPSGRTPGAPRPTEPEPAPPSIEVPEFPRPPRTDGLVLGGDVSWPQCPEGMGIPERRSKGLPMPLPSARFVVLGLTNGPGFTTNPCLAQQVGGSASGG
jgi:hypothetical protein